MTTPLERSRAVLWAGSLLIALNGDRRVPMPYRQMATAIARHFPTVEDVAHAATLSLLRDAGGMFEHPRDCGNWQDTCPGSSLTHHTRLNWPSEDRDDGIEGDTDPSAEFEMDGEATREDLEEQIESVERAEIALRRRIGRLYTTCLTLHPSLQAFFAAMAWKEQQSIAWISGAHFDGGTKTAGHLILEDRHEDLDDQLSALLRQYPAG